MFECIMNVLCFEWPSHKHTHRYFMVQMTVNGLIKHTRTSDDCRFSDPMTSLKSCVSHKWIH